MPLDTLLSIGLGVGLASAAGLRVFVPLFGAGLAASFGAIGLHDGFAWLASTPALIAMGTAMMLEIVAFHIPWLDHALDVIASPAAVIAGIVSSAAVVVDVPEWMRWGIAIVAGGGAAGMIQALTIGVRVKSSALTGGLANPGVATVETAGAFTLVGVAILVPLAALLVAALGGFLLYRWRSRRRT